MRKSDIQTDLYNFKKHLPEEIGIQLDQFLGRVSADYLQKNPETKNDLTKLITPLTTVKSSTILGTEFPPIPWLVSEYLGPGLTFLYGKPKVGKSFLSLQLGLSVLVGRNMFSQLVEKGKVLYLALEDNERRLQQRMKKQKWPTNASIDFMLYDKFRQQIGTLNSKGGKRLLAHIKAEGYTLVIIDTFSRAIHGNQLKVDQMTEAIGPIQQYAMKHNISLVIVDHEPKHGSTLFGSVAKLGIADSFWRLHEESGKRGAILSISGRDHTKKHNLQLEFDGDGCLWNLIGNPAEVEKTQRDLDIIKALKMLGRAQVKDIADTVGLDKGSIFRRLQDLVNKGLVKRIEEYPCVFYELP